MKSAILIGMVVAIAAVTEPSNGQQRTITLPNETATYVASQLPGYQLVQRNCAGCHSAHYAAMQPPSSPRAWWEATVKKMKKPFGAPFPDDDIAAMVDYLVKTYGAERTAAGR
jgi:mono/diheme cytochrome c family protein